MAKLNQPKEEKTPPAVEQNQDELNSLIQSGQGAAESSEVKEAPVPSPPVTARRPTSAERPQCQPGDPCPRRGCRGQLVLMNTHKTRTQTIRQYNCTSCKLMGGESRTSR